MVCQVVVCQVVECLEVACLVGLDLSLRQVVALDQLLRKSTNLEILLSAEQFQINTYHVEEFILIVTEIQENDFQIRRQS